MPSVRQTPLLIDQHLARMNEIKRDLKSHLGYFLNATDESTEIKARAQQCKSLLKEVGGLNFILGKGHCLHLWRESKIGGVINKFATVIDEERQPDLRVPRRLARILVMMIRALNGCQGRTLEALNEYRKRKGEIEGQGRPKPDMQAYKELRAKYVWLCQRRHGLNDEIPVGLVVEGRGEAAFLGIHSSILSGIDSVKDYPCYAVCLAGKYNDDELDDDDGTIIYTGSGGQDKKGRQVEDQKEGVDNASLLQAMNENTPIRVLRKFGDKNGCRYRYEGLYECTDFSYEASGDGPKVFKFKLKPTEQSTRYFKSFAPKTTKKRVALPPFSESAPTNKRKEPRAVLSRK